MNLQVIQKKINEIRGLKVMLDYDLAALYEVEPKYIKQFKDVYDAINFLLQKDKQKMDHEQRKRIGFKNQ